MVSLYNCYFWAVALTTQTNNSIMYKIVLIIIVIPLLISCHNKQTAATNQGVITYKINYSEEVQAKSFASFLPTTMVTTYKKDNYKLTIKGSLSLYNLEYISRADGDSSTTLFRIFDKRMFHKHNKGEFLFLFQNFEESKLEFFDNEIKNIAGIECKKVVIHYNNPELKSITVYYSEEIGFKRPNENSPFDDIPGTLMEFSLQYKGLDLKFEAQNIDMKKVDDKVFLVPENYTPSDHEEINELVGALIQ